MATTLSRRIRRIGLLPSTKDEQGNIVRNPDLTLTNEDRERQATALRAKAKARRIAAKKA